MRHKEVLYTCSGSRVSCHRTELQTWSQRPVSGHFTATACCFFIQGQSEIRENGSCKDVPFQAWEGPVYCAGVCPSPSLPAAVFPEWLKAEAAEHFPTGAGLEGWEVRCLLGNGCSLQMLFIFYTHTYIQCYSYCFHPNLIFAMKLILSAAVLPNVVFLKIWL